MNEFSKDDMGYKSYQSTNSIPQKEIVSWSIRIERKTHQPTRNLELIPRGEPNKLIEVFIYKERHV